MKDLAIHLAHRPGALAEMGEALGRAGISIEGGGGFVCGGDESAEYGGAESAEYGDAGVAHFLFEDGDAAAKALADAGIEVGNPRDVLIQRLDQETPGQLGMICRRMADAGVNIEVIYSDHANRLILVVDDLAKGRAVSEAWNERERPRAPAGTGA
jgi:hypothetical protein